MKKKTKKEEKVKEVKETLKQPEGYDPTLPDNKQRHLR